MQNDINLMIVACDAMETSKDLAVEADYWHPERMWMKSMDTTDQHVCYLRMCVHRLNNMQFDIISTDRRAMQYQKLSLGLSRFQ